MHRFRQDRRGIAALEFALLSTFILLPLFLGLIEILTLYRAESKLTAFTVDLSQMVAYELQAADGVNYVATTPGSIIAGTTLNNTSLEDVCEGAVRGLAPFPGNGMTVAIASVTQEAGPLGLPTSDTTISTGTGGASYYNIWETDFSVSGTTCNVNTSGTTIGAANAQILATTSPPSLTGTTGNTGMVEVPCDNAIIVKASLVYPGILGVVLHSRPTLTQYAYSRWTGTWIAAELQCSGTGCTTQYADSPPNCNTTNTSAIN